MLSYLSLAQNLTSLKEKLQGNPFHAESLHKAPLGKMLACRLLAFHILGSTTALESYLSRGSAAQSSLSSAAQNDLVWASPGRCLAAAFATHVQLLPAPLPFKRISQNSQCASMSCNHYLSSSSICSIMPHGDTSAKNSMERCSLEDVLPVHHKLAHRCRGN